MLKCYGIVFLRPDGTPANRVDYYTSKDNAKQRFDKSNAIHGSYPNGNPRWRLVVFAEAAVL